MGLKLVWSGPALLMLSFLLTIWSWYPSFLTIKRIICKGSDAWPYYKKSLGLFCLCFYFFIFSCFLTPLVQFFFITTISTIILNIFILITLKICYRVLKNVLGIFVFHLYLLLSKWRIYTISSSRLSLWNICRSKLAMESSLMLMNMISQWLIR